MGFIRDWRHKRILQRYAIPPADWHGIATGLPVLDGLDAHEIEQLRQLATLFLYEKHLEPQHGLQVSDRMRWSIAALATLPILNLGISCYDGWRSLVLYPGAFVTRHEWTDEIGLVHSRREVQSGEAWQHGPMILSWSDVEASGQCEGYNTVIHECAHKIDMRNGSANGQPTLHRGMDGRAWHDIWLEAFEDFSRRVRTGRDTALDPYGADSPAEFFAVLSEHFFETPRLLAEEYPAVYQQLVLFYRQDPALRLG